jgi:hypothetical protein
MKGGKFVECLLTPGKAAARAAWRRDFININRKPFIRVFNWPWSGRSVKDRPDRSSRFPSL